MRLRYLFDYLFVCKPLIKAAKRMAVLLDHVAATKQTPNFEDKIERQSLEQRLKTKLLAYDMRLPYDPFLFLYFPNLPMTGPTYMTQEWFEKTAKLQLAIRKIRVKKL